MTSFESKFSVDDQVFIVTKQGIVPATVDTIKILCSQTITIEYVLTSETGTTYSLEEYLHPDIDSALAAYKIIIVGN